MTKISEIGRVFSEANSEFGIIGPSILYPDSVTMY